MKLAQTTAVTFQLLRFPAVITSSLAGMFIGFAVSWAEQPRISCLNLALALIGVILLHGVTTHASNDLQDFRSGTDLLSPGILSGGSGVLTDGKADLKNVTALRDTAALIVAGIGLYLTFIIGLKVLLVLVIGLWSAYGYTEPPLLLAYRPLIGEWLGEFPAMVTSSVGAALVLTGHVPTAAWAGAIINALFCLGWLMQHHLPDIPADLAAVPPKLTTVAYLYRRSGCASLKLPSYCYFGLVLPVALWAAVSLHPAFLVSLLIGIYCLYLTSHTSVNSVPDITANLLLMQFATLVHAVTFSLLFWTLPAVSSF